MNINEALNVLKKVCAEFVGTLGDHQTLQQALTVVSKGCSKKDEQTKEVPVREEEGTKEVV